MTIFNIGIQILVDLTRLVSGNKKAVVQQRGVSAALLSRPIFKSVLRTSCPFPLSAELC